MKSISCAVYEDNRFPDMSLTLYCRQDVNDNKYTSIQRECSGAVGSDTALQDGRSRVRLLMVSLEFFINFISPVALWLWGQLIL